METLPFYEVEADRETGEWLGKPKLIGHVSRQEWARRVDSDHIHFDTYEVAISPEKTETETRAIAIIWI